MEEDTYSLIKLNHHNRWINWNQTKRNLKVVGYSLFNLVVIKNGGGRRKWRVWIGNRTGAA